MLYPVAVVFLLKLETLEQRRGFASRNQFDEDGVDE
jgi:hypothetical protein